MPTTLPRDRTVTFAEYDAWFRQNNGKPATQQDYQTYLALRNDPVPFDPFRVPDRPQGPLAATGGRPVTPISGYQSGPTGGPDFGGGQQQGSGGGAAGGVLDRIWNWVKDNPEILLAGYNAWNASRAGQRSQDYQNQAIGFERERWEAGAPLRAQAMSMLQAPLPTGPDFSAQFRDTGNPYVRPPLPATGGGGAGAQFSPSLNQSSAAIVPPAPPPPGTNQGGTMTQGVGYVPGPTAVPTGRRAMPRILPAF